MHQVTSVQSFYYPRWETLFVLRAEEKKNSKYKNKQCKTVQNSAGLLHGEHGSFYSYRTWTRELEIYGLREEF